VNQRRPFDARASVRSLARRWRLLSAFLAVGLLAAFAYTSLSPRHLGARSVVLLPPPPVSGSGTTRDMGTEARIATSAPVLATALKATRTNLSVDQLRQLVSASAVTSSLLEIRVDDASSSRAVKLANAVARAYIAYSRELGSQSAVAQVRVLEAQASELTKQLTTLEAQVADQTASLSTLAPGTPAAARASAELNTSQTNLGTVSRNLEEVNQAISTAKRDGAAGAADGAQVLEPATTATEPSLLTAARPFLTAVLVALVAAWAVTLKLDRRDERARRRKDIAAAIGAPVIASLEAGDLDASDGEEMRALDAGTDGALRDEEAIRALSRHLAGDEEPATSLVVVSLRGDDTASRVVRRLSAAAARSEETPELAVEVVPLLTDGSELTLNRRYVSMPAVMVVSAGFAHHRELSGVASLMRAAACPFAGVIVANPDPRDATGVLSETSTELAPTRVSGVAWEEGS
jgi:capsular polysaccharide biosynthesis protein